MALFTPEQAQFLDGPNSLVVATQDSACRPACTRALILRTLPDRERVVVTLPAAICRETVANLAVEPRIAIGVSRPSTHLTFQLKGRALRVNDSPPEHRAVLDAAFAAFIEETGKVGLPRRLLEPVVLWPAVDVEVLVTAIYDQTPGPGAGNPLAPREGA